jgi:mannose-1-phosphate guanylyltransferase
MKAMMLTAGLGTRLRPLTNLYAKPTVPFLGVPLACFGQAILQQAGARSFVMNTHHLPEQIEDLAVRMRLDGLDVETSHEAGVPLGSGGGIWKARNLLEGGGDFLVANGDEIILPHRPFVMRDFVSAHRSKKALASILVMHHPLVGSQFGGVWCDSKGAVRGFGKDGSKFGADAIGYHYIGILMLNDRIFEYLPEGESNILYDALAAAIARGEVVQAIESTFTWFETGNPKDFLSAIKEAIPLLEQGKGEDASALRAITQRFRSPGTTIEHRETALVYAAPDSSVPALADLNGVVVLESGAQIEAGASVENCILFPGARVRSGEKRKNELVLPS